MRHARPALAPAALILAACSGPAGMAPGGPNVGLPSPAGPATATTTSMPAPTASATTPIEWGRGLSGLGFHDYFAPSLPAFDSPASPPPGGVVIYRLYGRNVSKTGLQPQARSLGDEVWQFDFHTPADGKSRRAQPGSGRPFLHRELTAPADVFKPGWALDRRAATVDSPAAAAAVAGAATGDMWLLSAAEYQAATGRPTGAPVWKVDLAAGGVAYVDAGTGAVLKP